MNLKNIFYIMCFILSFYSVGYAGVPVWTFVPLTATSIVVSAAQTATIQYEVTNQSEKSKNLVMTPITGITQTTTGVGVCSNPFTLPSKGSSCILSLLVDGSRLTHSITDGPIICEQGSKLQCYQPSPLNVLNINVSAVVDTHTVGGTVSGMSGNIVLQNNGTDNETVSSDGAFTFATALEEGSSYDVTVLTQPTEQTCTVENGAGVIETANITDVLVRCGSDEPFLSASVSTLALSINDTDLNAAMTGTPRIITITNTGGASAMNVTYSYSTALPSGTTITSSNCGTIPPFSDCIITITPGNAPSAPSGETSPTPITLNISGTGTNTLTPTINILTYGSVYQGGYVFAVDDTTPNTESIGGSVVSLTDQVPRWPNGVFWSSNGDGGLSRDIIPGIAETSTTSASVPTYASAQSTFNETYSNTNTYPFPSSGSFLSCDGRADGSCNSANILTLYNTYATNYNIGSSPYTLSPGPTTVSYYSAGACTTTINEYSDWYLPAICEMGPDSNDTGCSASTQNITSQLPDLIGSTSAVDPDTSCVYGSNCLAGFYWSSTESASFGFTQAWSQRFLSEGSDSPLLFKNGKLGIRCTRSFTN